MFVRVIGTLLAAVSGRCEFHPGYRKRDSGKYLIRIAKSGDKVSKNKESCSNQRICGIDLTVSGTTSVEKGTRFLNWAFPIFLSNTMIIKRLNYCLCCIVLFQSKIIYPISQIDSITPACYYCI